MKLIKNIFGVLIAPVALIVVAVLLIGAQIDYILTEIGALIWKN